MTKQLLSALFVLSLALPGETTAQVDLSRTPSANMLTAGLLC